VDLELRAGVILFVKIAYCPPKMKRYILKIRTLNEFDFGHSDIIELQNRRRWWTGPGRNVFLVFSYTGNQLEWSLNPLNTLPDLPCRPIH